MTDLGDVDDFAPFDPAGPVTGLIDCMRGLALVLDRYRQDLADRCGVGVQDTPILIALLAPGQQSRPSDLAHRLGITSGSLTSMLDRLETAGMVQRRRHPTDRRSVFVDLTPAGTQRLTEGRRTLQDIALSSIPIELRAAVSTGLCGFTHALEAHLNTREPAH